MLVQNSPFSFLQRHGSFLPALGCTHKTRVGNGNRDAMDAKQKGETKRGRHGETAKRREESSPSADFAHNTIEPLNLTDTQVLPPTRVVLHSFLVEAKKLHPTEGFVSAIVDIRVTTSRYGCVRGMHFSQPRNHFVDAPIETFLPSEFAKVGWRLLELI